MCYINIVLHIVVIYTNNVFLIADLNYIFVSKMDQRLKIQKQILRKRASIILSLCMCEVEVDFFFSFFLKIFFK